MTLIQVCSASNSCTLKKKKILYTSSDTVWNISEPYHCLHSVHDRSLNRNAHWQKPEARRLPHFFFFINCTLLSRFTANFCQLQCSLSAKMWVWSFVLRGMMQPSCNTKQIMLLATEVFLVPFFKRISFYIVKFHFFNSVHPRSSFFSAFVHNKVLHLSNSIPSAGLNCSTVSACIKRFAPLVLFYVFVYFPWSPIWADHWKHIACIIHTVSLRTQRVINRCGEKFIDGTSKDSSVQVIMSARYLEACLFLF